MSIEQSEIIVQGQSIAHIGDLLSMRDLTTLLIKHYGLHEGKYDLLLEFKIGMGAVGPADARLPGAMLGVSKVGLASSKDDSVSFVDASEVNPKKASRVRAPKK